MRETSKMVLKAAFGSIPGLSKVTVHRWSYGLDFLVDGGFYYQNILLSVALRKR